MILNIVVGLIGLGIVVLVHELGHFFSAKACGIKIETFSLGWGKKLLSYKGKETEYCLSLLPLGGYCRLKGEDAFKKAIEENSDTIEKSEGSLFSASPLKRIITIFSGPLFNFIFAVFVLSLIWFFGFNIKSYSNKVILLSNLRLTEKGKIFPADEAGIKTGDKIVKVNNKIIENYHDIQEAVGLSTTEIIKFSVEREGSVFDVDVKSELNKDIGSRFIGVSAWIEPIVFDVKINSPANIAGLRKNDRILKVNNVPVQNQIEIINAMDKSISEIVFERDGEEKNTKLFLDLKQNEYPELGIMFKYDVYRNSTNGSIISAMQKGFQESVKILNTTIHGLSLLFKGINLKNAVSGPIRITYYVGEITTEGFKDGISEGFTSLFKFLSFLSIALFFMNLLPIPVLDGGMIFITIIEMIIRKPLKPRILYRFQLVGFAFILVLVIFSTFNDISFLMKK